MYQQDDNNFLINVKIDTKLQEMINAKVREQINKLRFGELNLDSSIIKGIIVESVNASIGKRIDDFVRDCLRKFDEQLEITKRFMLDYNERFLSSFNNSGAELENVKIFIYDTTIPNEEKGAEEIVIDYYKEEGLDARKLNSLRNFGKSEVMTDFVYEQILNDYVGKPDLIVYGLGSFFLVEVKQNGDGVKMEQALWYKRHSNIPIIIFYVNRKVIKNEK